MPEGYREADWRKLIEIERERVQLEQMRRQPWLFAQEQWFAIPRLEREILSHRLGPTWPQMKPWAPQAMAWGEEPIGEWRPPGQLSPATLRAQQRRLTEIPRGIAEFTMPGMAELITEPTLKRKPLKEMQAFGEAALWQFLPVGAITPSIRASLLARPGKAAQLAAKLLKPLEMVETAFIPPKKANIPIGTLETPTQKITRERALRNIADEFYEAVVDSQLDMASTSYLQRGDFRRFIAQMPEFTKLTADEAADLAIAVRVTKAGREVPAMRKSGFFVNQEFADFAHVDVGYVSGMWQDPTRMMQAIDGGFFGGATQKYVLWPTRRTVLASIRFGDEEKMAYRFIQEQYGMVGKKRLRQTAGDVIQHISHDEAKVPIKQLLQKSDILKFVKRLKPADQERVVRYAQATRRTFDDLIDKQNLARVKRAQDSIPYRDNYRPWVIETNIWSRLSGLRKRPPAVMERPQLPDFVKPTQPFNPRALAREGGMYKYHKERDLQKLVFDYVDTATKDIFNTNIVHNAKIHAQVLRSKGLASSSALIDDWAAEAYAGITPGIARGIRRVVPMKVIQPGLWLRRRLTSAVFPLNWTWNLFVQTSSGALTLMRYGVRNSIRGLDYLFSPTARRWTRENAYSAIIKQRRAGKVAYQDLGAGIEQTLKFQGSALEKFEHYLNFFTNTLEDALTGCSVRAAYHDGLRMGFRGRALTEYASEGGAKTQSMYNLQDLPGVLRSKEIGALAPFQTFAFEVFNSTRELNIIGIRRIVGRAGAYETISATSALGKATIAKRLRMITEWFAALTVINLYVDKAINRKPWNASSFIPFWAVMTGGVNAGNPWNQILPLRYSQELHSGIISLLKYGDWRKMRKWAVRYHIPAGVQVERMLGGMEAVMEGRVTDVRGRTLFEVPPEEALRAILMGAYQTEQGKEYIDKMQESKGFLYEHLGIPMPELGEPEEPGRQYKIPQLR